MVRKFVRGLKPRYSNSGFLKGPPPPAPASHWSAPCWMFLPASSELECNWLLDTTHTTVVHTQALHTRTQRPEKEAGGLSTHILEHYSSQAHTRTHTYGFKCRLKRNLFQFVAAAEDQVKLANLKCATAVDLDYLLRLPCVLEYTYTHCILVCSSYSTSKPICTILTYVQTIWLPFCWPSTCLSFQLKHFLWHCEKGDIVGIWRIFAHCKCWFKKFATVILFLITEMQEATLYSTDAKCPDLLYFN